MKIKSKDDLRKVLIDNSAISQLNKLVDALQTDGKDDYVLNVGFQISIPKKDVEEKPLAEVVKLLQSEVKKQMSGIKKFSLDV